MNKRRSSLEISYVGGNDVNSTQCSRGNVKIDGDTSIELKINGRLKHVFKPSENNYLHSVVFPSGRLLGYISRILSYIQMQHKSSIINNLLLILIPFSFSGSIYPKAGCYWKKLRMEIELRPTNTNIMLIKI